MNKKISFHNMDHSDPLEQHARAKIAKIEELLKREKNHSPMNLELRLTSNKPHPHHHAELHVKTPRFDLNSHDEGPDMYIIVDNTIDKMVKLIKKHKDISRTKNKSISTEKTGFASDKYSLSDILTDTLDEDLND